MRRGILGYALYFVCVAAHSDHPRSNRRVSFKAYGATAGGAKAPALRAEKRTGTKPVPQLAWGSGSKFGGTDVTELIIDDNQ